jgi:DNA-directed RNA polymerase sigma subunit (sigma70/sigma32)
MDTIKLQMLRVRYLDKRKRAIVRLRKRGATLDAIGKWFGISKQRVHVILRDSK